MLINSVHIFATVVSRASETNVDTARMNSVTLIVEVLVK